MPQKYRGRSVCVSISPTPIFQNMFIFVTALTPKIFAKKLPSSSQIFHLQPRAMYHSIALPHQVNVIKKNQSRTPPIKKTTPICLPSFILPHVEIFHVQNIVLEPLYDPPRGLAYFDTSRGVPAYSQCPRSTEGDRCVSRYLQHPYSKICSYL